MEIKCKYGHRHKALLFEPGKIYDLDEELAKKLLRSFPLKFARVRTIKKVRKQAKDFEQS